MDPEVIISFYGILISLLIFKFLLRMVQKPSSNLYRFFNIRVTKRFNLTPASIIISFAIASASVYLAYRTMINVSYMNYPYSYTNGSIFRGFGRLVEVSLGIIFIPTNKMTFINRIFGWTIFHNLHHHKLFGIIVFVCIFFHSIGMFLNYFVSTGLTLLFSLNGDEYVILYAMIAFFMLIVTAVTTTKCIRKTSYTLFYYVYIYYYY